MVQAWRMMSLADRLAEVGNGGIQTLIQGDAGLPAQFTARQINHRLALKRIISRKRSPNQVQIRINFVPDQLGQLTNRKFARITDIDRTRVLTIHQPDNAINKVIDIAKAASLATVTVEG
jgi:hypothetical protein